MESALSSPNSNTCHASRLSFNRVNHQPMDQKQDTLLLVKNFLALS
jgi:hypothetical protein